jgi:hypothetical protein
VWIAYAKSTGVEPRGRALMYFQCAAMPYSAVRCMAAVRICTSSVLPSGPTTVVCKLW